MTRRATVLAGGAVGGSSPALAAPLRALRHQPALVDDHAAARLLAASASGALAPESVRWARAWLICSQAVVAAEPRLGTEESAHLAFDAGRVAAPRGLGDSARQSAALAALITVGVLRSAIEGDGGSVPGRVCWAAEICEVHSAAVTIDWPGVVALCGRESAALLVVRTLAEYVVPAHDWTVVPRRDLIERTGYMQKQVRMALRRLETVGLIESEGESGRTARYRFTPRALAPRWAQPLAFGPSLVTPDSPEVLADVQNRSAGSTPAARRSALPPTSLELAPAAIAAPAGEQGIDLVMAGVTVRMAPGTSIDVGAGARAQVEVGVDGRLSLKVLPS